MNLTLKPRAGLIVRDPETRLPLAAAGEVKPRMSYWLRRLSDGDVVEVVPASPPVPFVPPALPKVQPEPVLPPAAVPGGQS